MRIEGTTYNSTFAIGRFLCSADPPRRMVAKSFVLRMYIYASFPAHRKCANR
jgi:hypothetical protein